MSKDNREMEDISGKFRKWLLEKDKWGLPRRRTDMCSDTLEIGFFYGYTIAQKEMQNALENKGREMVQVKHLYKHLEEQLDEAIEVIEKTIRTSEFLYEYADCKNKSWAGCGCAFCKDVESKKNIREARDFLKARGEK